MSSGNGRGSSDKSFVIEDRPDGQTLVVTGRWSDGAEHALARQDVDAVELNYAHGFRESDLGFVRDWSIRRLTLLDRRTGLDLSPLGRISALEELRVETDPASPIDLGEFPRLKLLAADWSQVTGSMPSSAGLRSLLVGQYTLTNLDEIATLSDLRSLHLQGAPALDSLTGIGSLASLEVLRIFGARQLRDLSALGTLGETLRELELEACPMIDSLDGVETLTGLRFLGVSDCGEITSLGPLRELKRLETLHAWGTTRVLDEDLSVVAALPNLREVRMRDRRGYQPRVADLSVNE